MWKDADGNIVTKKPALGKDVQPSQPPFDGSLTQPTNFVPFQQESGAPISPPISHNPSSLGQPNVSDHGTSVYPSTLGVGALPTGGYSPTLDQRFWSTDPPQPEPESFAANNFDDASFDEIFNPDTASSFNNPFTTMNNYSWLFDMDLSRQNHVLPTIPDAFPPFQFPPNTITHSSHAFDLQLNNTITDKTLPTDGQYESLPSQRTNSLLEPTPPTLLASPPLTDEELNGAKPGVQTSSVQKTAGTTAEMPLTREPQHTPAIEIERPLSMLQPSRSLPIIDQLARAQLLDLIDITQPIAPDGSLVTRDHHLLSLSCLQTYCDLFFTRFNTTYPLIHMSTFGPSHVDILFLTSVLLLGATYGEKDAHQLAARTCTYAISPIANEPQVCIHDVLRPQIFANAGFSSKPELWVLQTILLVECFGKSRAGQKQHEMSHLFHGLLINLIRRSDCQTIRPPTLEDATEDLEDDWQTWADAEQKKRSVPTPTSLTHD